MLHHLFAGLPSLCAICHSWPARPVCEACVARFARPVPRCTSCALPMPDGVTVCGDCRVHPPPLDACLAAVDYGYPWSDLIADFKFRARPGRAGAMAQLMCSMPHVEAALDSADCVLPIPLSDQRLRLRGYNQAWELARRLAPRRRQAQPDALLRVVDTPAQLELHRQARLDNLRHAFAINPLRQAALQHRRVVLVDDVMTTGASLHAAATVLRQAGVSHVTGLVFARTDLR